MLNKPLRDLNPREQEYPKDPPAITGQSALMGAISASRDALYALQHEPGYWCFELEADCTIPAEYILMMHFMDEIEPELESKIAVFLRRKQCENGGWALYHGGGFDISCSVKVYYALKIAGDSQDAPHMVKARAAILAHGGASRCNVFTRITLALFRQIPWRGVPIVPVEIMLLPRWFPFHLSKISYWARTVMVPLAVLCSLKTQARNPRAVGIQELFTTPPEQEKNYFPIRSRLNRWLLRLDYVCKFLEPAIPGFVRRRAMQKAEQWFIERLNGDDGLGAIFPAMVNAHEALAHLGYSADHPYRQTTGQALRKLLVVREDSAYCQPCLSPVWDTALSVLALHQAEGEKATPELLRALDWLKDRQLSEEPGDWRDSRPRLRGGGWPFQFGNSYYPDVDDTAIVGWAMFRADRIRYADSLQRAAEWVSGMQSRNGGFAAFDVDNTFYYLNEIPFADHGALLDPPTSDVSARCIALLAQLGGYEPVCARCLDFLKSEQEENGSWFGRWGTNYIYGTWSVLTAIEFAGESTDQAYIRHAVEWLKRVQRPDGGWGESNDTYLFPEKAGQGNSSNSFHTSWAMLALMAAGEADSPEVARGAEYLMSMQRADGLWNDPDFTAPGFPRVFYLKYHGYDKIFPLWALARYYNLHGHVGA